MAFDLYSGGSLFYHIHRRTAPEIANTGRLAAGLHGLSDETVRFYGAEVVAGLGYLHQVMHARMVTAVIYAPMRSRTAQSTVLYTCLDPHLYSHYSQQRH